MSNYEIILNFKILQEYYKEPPLSSTQRDLFYENILWRERVQSRIMGCTHFSHLSSLLQPGTILQVSLTLITLTLWNMTGQAFCNLSLSLGFFDIFSPLDRYVFLVNISGKQWVPLIPSNWVTQVLICSLTMVVTLITYIRSASFLCCKVTFSSFIVSEYFMGRYFEIM